MSFIDPNTLHLYSFVLSSHLAEKILSTYLFPDLSLESSEPIVPQTPVMHHLTRQKLYNIINLLCKRSDDVYANVLDQMEAIVPRGMS